MRRILYIVLFIFVLCIASIVGSCNSKDDVKAYKDKVQLDIDIDITEKALLYNDGVYPTDSLINRLRELKTKRERLWNM